MNALIFQRLLPLTLLCCVLTAGNLNSFAQFAKRPSIGLALSGGGAKGLAHIGILKALDSAGVKVDYITGTSMGSIIGGLYASGYSGNEIEQIARNIDWSSLLSNRTTLRSLAMEEKEEYGRYALELPYMGRKFRLPTGALEGQELWLKFSELFFPVYHIKDFNKLPIPFKCIATDVATAEAVVQDRGELITALRASMAIPGAFTSVQNFGRSLVDGGVVRNFPVSDARAMGADIVIGSNVSEGLRPKELLTNPIQILTQIVFFKEAEDHKKQIAQCDYYINQELDGYFAVSFDRATAIIDSGIARGRELYPIIKHTVDSFNAVYGEPLQSYHTTPRIESVLISAYDVTGLKKIRSSSFIHSLRFESGRCYTANELATMIRRGYGTRNYDYIHYSLHPVDSGNAKIVFDVRESASTSTKLGIHFNTFMGLSLVANHTTRNFFTTNSRSSITLNVGENFRARASHLQYLGRLKYIAIVPEVQFETFKIDTYDDGFKKDGIYRQNYFKGDIKLQSANSLVFTGGVGARYEWMKYEPLIQSAFQAKGSNRFYTGYAFFDVNTLDRTYLPERGIRIHGQAGWIFDQRPSLTFTSNGEIISTPDSAAISDENYLQTTFNAEQHHRLNRRFTLSTYYQSAINFASDQNVFNAFSIGGLNRMYRNQIVFPGLSDMSTYSSSVAALQFSLRMRLSNAFYVIAHNNLLAKDFISVANRAQQNTWLTGHALSVAYNSLLGPIELSAMYSEQSRRVQGYVSIGFSF